MGLTTVQRYCAACDVDVNQSTISKEKFNIILLLFYSRVVLVDF